MSDSGNNRFDFSDPIPVFDPSELNCPNCPNPYRRKTEQLLARIVELEYDFQWSVELNEGLREEHLKEIQSFRQLLDRMGVMEKQLLENEVLELKQENGRLNEDMREMNLRCEQLELDAQNWLAESSECVLRNEDLEVELDSTREENTAINGRLGIQLDLSRSLAKNLQEKERLVSNLQHKIDHLEMECKGHEVKVKNLEDEDERKRNLADEMFPHISGLCLILIGVMMTLAYQLLTDCLKYFDLA